MFCNQCGREISDDAKFCKYCGYDRTSTLALSAKEIQKAETDFDPDKVKLFNDTIDSYKKINVRENAKPRPKKKEKAAGKKKGSTALIILLVFFLLLGGVGAYVFLNYRDLKYRFFPDEIKIFGDVYQTSFDYNWPNNKRPVSCARADSNAYCKLVNEEEGIFLEYMLGLLNSDDDRKWVQDGYATWRRMDTYYEKYPFILGYGVSEDMFDDNDVPAFNSYNIFMYVWGYNTVGTILYYLEQMNRNDRLDVGLAMYALKDSGYMLDDNNVRMYDKDDNEITDVSKLNDGDIITVKLKYAAVYSEDNIFLNGFLSRNVEDNQRLFEDFHIPGNAADFTSNLNDVLDSISDYDDILKILNLKLENPSIEIRYDKTKTAAGDKYGIWQKQSDGNYIVVDGDGSIYARTDLGANYSENNRTLIGNIREYYSVVSNGDTLTITKGPLSGNYKKADEAALNSGSSSAAPTPIPDSQDDSGDDDKKEEKVNVADYYNTSNGKINNSNVVTGMSSGNRTNLKEIQIFARNGVTYRYDYNDNQSTVENPIDDSVIGFLQLKKKSEIRIRDTYSTSGKIVGHVYEYAQVPYYETKKNGGYTWYLIDKANNYWLADDGTWVELYNYE